MMNSRLDANFVASDDVDVVAVNGEGIILFYDITCLFNINCNYSISLYIIFLGASISSWFARTNSLQIQYLLVHVLRAIVRSLRDLR